MFGSQTSIPIKDSRIQQEEAEKRRDSNPAALFSLFAPVDFQLRFCLSSSDSSGGLESGGAPARQRCVQANRRPEADAGERETDGSMDEDGDGGDIVE